MSLPEDHPSEEIRAGHFNPRSQWSTNFGGVSSGFGSPLSEGCYRGHCRKPHPGCCLEAIHLRLPPPKPILLVQHDQPCHNSDQDSATFYRATERASNLGSKTSVHNAIRVPTTRGIFLHVFRDRPSLTVESLWTQPGSAARFLGFNDA